MTGAGAGWLGGESSEWPWLPGPREPREALAGLLGALQVWTGSRSAWGLSGHKGGHINRNLYGEFGGAVRGSPPTGAPRLTVELSGGIPLSRAQMVRL